MDKRLAAVAGISLAAIPAYIWSTSTAEAPKAALPPLKNQAFVFVKPHAATDKVAAVVKKGLEGKGIKVLSEGDISSKEIDEKKLIDQHYYAIASKATILKPDQLNVPADKFKKAFGKDWAQQLKDGKVFNALDACQQLGVKPAELNKLWAGAKKSDKLVKFGGGFYCGELTHKGKTIYVLNGFFMEMRDAFTAPGKKIHYYSVEWDPAQLPWSDFRGKLLGPTDPKDAPAESLRGSIMRTWKELGLAAEPNVGDNAVHASASPFEGMAERMNWLGVKCQEDAFCTALVKRAGIPEATVHEWTKDPQVVINAEGKKGSLFDALEDLDADASLAKAKALWGLQKQ